MAETNYDEPEQLDPRPDAIEAVGGRDRELLSSLDELAGLVAASLTLDALLERVAGSASHAISGADGAGVTLLSSGQVDNVQTLAASEPFVASIEKIQYEVLDEGPCITAAQQGSAVVAGSLGGDRRWPRFGPRVGRLGVHSVIALPLILPNGTIVGALNVYSRTKDAFDADAVRVGELFAAPAAIAVFNAQVLDRAQQQTEQLKAALVSRTVIDQAIGIIRSRSGGTPTEAFERLRTISQSENTKLALVAERIVAEAVRRARARRPAQS